MRWRQPTHNNIIWEILSYLEGRRYSIQSQFIRILFGKLFGYLSNSIRESISGREGEKEERLWLRLYIWDDFLFALCYFGPSKWSTKALAHPCRIFRNAFDLGETTCRREILKEKRWNIEQQENGREREKNMINDKLITHPHPNTIASCTACFGEEPTGALFQLRGREGQQFELSSSKSNSYQQFKRW